MRDEDEQMYRPHSLESAYTDAVRARDKALYDNGTLRGDVKELEKRLWRAERRLRRYVYATAAAILPFILFGILYVLFRS